MNKGLISMLFGASLLNGCYTNHYLPVTTKVVDGVRVEVFTTGCEKPDVLLCLQPTQLTMKVNLEGNIGAVFIDEGFNGTKPTIDIARIGSGEYFLSHFDDAEAMLEAQIIFDKYWTKFQSAPVKDSDSLSRAKVVLDKF